MRRSIRLLLLCCGHLALLVGLIGIFLPLLPTTPFLLLAAFLYSRASPRFHRWLLDHPRLGVTIRDWSRHGVIRLRAKLLGTVVVIASLSIPLVFQGFAWPLKLLAAATGIAVLVFLWTRPSRVAGGGGPTLENRESEEPRAI